MTCQKQQLMMSRIIPKPAMRVSHVNLNDLPIHMDSYHMEPNVSTPLASSHMTARQMSHNNCTMKEGLQYLTLPRYPSAKRSETSAKLRSENSLYNAASVVNNLCSPQYACHQTTNSTASDHRHSPPEAIS